MIKEMEQSEQLEQYEGKTVKVIFENENVIHIVFTDKSLLEIKKR